MAEADLAARACAFREKVRSCRPSIEAALREGAVSLELLAELSSLEAEEKALLEEALPSAREKLIATRDMGGRREVLLKDATKISESGLPDEVKALVAEHLGEDAELAEPELPLEPEETGEGIAVQGVVLKGNLWCTVSDGTVCFAITDEGAAYLLERNLTWKIAPEPLAEECFPARIVQESPASCLFVDVDGALERLSYNRLDTAEALLREQLYA